MPAGMGYAQSPSMTGARKRTAPSGVNPVRGVKAKRKKKDRMMMAAR